MKKAFTLIELLVVIAIIAILAAILFPVFAQAKLAAKKAVSISNQKQLNLAIIMYAGDYDDTYPRQDGCTLNDSLEAKWNVQPAGTDPTPWCTGVGNGTNDPQKSGSGYGQGGYAFRDNHYNWGKWIQPYAKSTGLLIHPAISPIYGTDTVNGVPDNWDQGEIASGYALNIAITGALNTYHATASTYGAIRNSFVGGTQTGIASPAEAMLTTEQSFEVVTGAWETNYNAQGTTPTPYWPAAFKEHWEAEYYKNGGTGDCGVQTGVVDPTKVPFNTIPLGYADGHTKAISAGQFIANTPTFEQFVGAPYPSTICNGFAAYGNASYTTPLIAAGAGLYPMWGL
jgi:prepilin-type N-terminal cleavage/methylation domain-containing protein